MKQILAILTLFYTQNTGNCVKMINVLGMEQEDSFGIYKLPAIFMGVEKINSIYRDVFRLNLLRTTFGPSCSPNGKAVAFANVYYNNIFAASFGPGCTNTVEPVGRMATSWNILMMITTGTDGMFDDQNDFSTLVRMSVSQNKFAIFYVEFFSFFSWTNIAIIYDQDAPFCPRWREAMEPTLATNGFEVHVFKTRSIVTSLPVYKQTLQQASKVARIFSLCCVMDEFRKLMIAAHELGMTNGDYLFLMCTRYNGDFFGNYSWYRGDEFDEIAREAWASVMMVKETRQSTPEFMAFEMELQERAWKEYNYTYEPEPGSSEIAYYDLFLIYGQILNETLAEGGNYSDGVYMKSKFKNRTFKGIGRALTFDDNAAVQPEYSLYDMDPVTGLFQVVGRYFGATQKFVLTNLTIDWPNNMGPPVNKPICGFMNENPDCAIKELNVLAIISGTLAGLLVLGLLIVLYAYRRLKIEAELKSQWWKIKPGAISFQSSNVSFGSRRSRLSMLRSTEDVASIKDSIVIQERCGLYQGRIVFLQKTKLKHLNLSRKSLIELKVMRDLPSHNLVKFTGLYHFEKMIYMVTDYVSRGSLQDIVQNDSINLTWDFKVALIADLTNGLAFLHDSLITVHGRLNSERCLIDSRFVLKIAGFGLTFIYGGDPLKSIDNDQEYLWFAPEVLRGECKVSQTADVYSFSMIVFEILTRMAPFEMDQDLLSVKEIICKLKEEGERIPFRPQLPCDVDKPKIVELINQCWDECPLQRPTLRTVKKQLKQMTGISTSSNILDSLLKRMEQYANNLEDLVSQRTEAFLEEKRKSEQLLDEVLPRSVATKLKNGQPVDPEAFECVTIYFSDIVGFTTISAQSSPIQVVDFLNNLYTMFDSIIDRFNVYKVETIGDAYMVVSGLPVRNENKHAREIAQMSLAILRDVRNFTIFHLPNHTLQARIGIHSGPVCAGVVGKKMPRYCLFGDTVNTASRMESHGQAMKIHISPQSKIILDSFGMFVLESRGLIDIKGKGRMVTYWLVDEQFVESEEMLPSHDGETFEQLY